MLAAIRPHLIIFPEGTADQYLINCWKRGSRRDHKYNRPCSVRRPVLKGFK